MHSRFPVNNRHRTKQGTALFAIAAIALLAVGLSFGRCTAPEGEATPTEVPSVIGNGSRVAQTEQGAIWAATEFAQILPGPVDSETEYRARMHELAAPGWEDRADELASNAISFIAERYGEGGRISFHPIRYRLTSYSGDSASVDVWGVVIASGPKLQGVEESWITGSIALTWVGDAWKVSGQSSVGGPTPSSLRTTDQVPAVDLERFHEYQDAPHP